MKNLLHLSTFVIIIGLVLSACTPLVKVGESADFPTSEPVSQLTSRPAQVQNVEIQIMNANPPQIDAIVRGNLSESCATLAPGQAQYASNVFQINLMALSPNDRGCAPRATPYETTIALDTQGLPAGNYTVIANGVSAVFTLSDGAMTPTMAAPTAMPVATNVAVPTAIPVATNVAFPTSSACTDSAKFIADVTIPDYTVIASNTAFTKTWRLKNTGSCTWDSSYLVAYISGSTMSQQPGYWIVQQGQTVVPGQTVDISVGLTSPVENGDYASYWGLKNSNGQFIPIQGGANGSSFYVKIKVNNGITINGNVTAGSIDIELEQGSGAVCTANSTYLVHAYIIADGPATASYEIGSTAGQISAGNFQMSPTGPVSPVVTGTLAFDQAATKTISLRFVGPYPYPSDITVLLRINRGEWYRARLDCQ